MKKSIMTAQQLKVNQVIKDYKLQIDGLLIHESNFNSNTKITIETGNNEGYYVTYTEEKISVGLRIHSKDEALKAMGCLLILMPNN